ncbi:hypothetical protein GBAR_LOCUS8026 [Geodia barretti]|nr:hypothetical protein GBAR_LOCUS8026 [Geodia barretti]
MEHILLLLTLVSGLDFISFDLQVDCDYLDYGASILSSKITSRTSSSTEVTPTFLSAKVNSKSGRPRTHSDPTPKPPGAIPSLTRGARKQTRNNKEAPAAGTASSEKSPEASGETGTNIENENGDNLIRNEGAGDSIPIPSTEEPRSSMMSSSLQMTSSRNLLERMSSLETKSPFLERAAASREGLRWRGAGQSGRGERVKDENGEEDDMVVAKGRRSGRSKKRRRKRNEENEVSDESSPRGHVTREENHVTREGNHVIPGAVLFSPTNTTTTTVDADDSVLVGAPHSMRTEECDYETEPVILQSLAEEKGLGLSLEMELALAARDEPGIQTSMSSGDAGGGDQLELHLPPSRDAAPSETPRVHLENLEESLPRTSGNNRNPFDVEEDVDLSPSLPPSTPPSFPDKNSDNLSNRQHRSHTIHHPPSSASTRSELKSDEKRNPRRVPLNSKPISSSSRSPPSAQHRSKSRREKGVTSEVEGEFDIITQSEVRALDGRRRTNALYSEDREGEREVGEGDEEDLVTVGKMVYHEPPQRPKTVTEEREKSL